MGTKFQDIASISNQCAGTHSPQEHNAPERRAPQPASLQLVRNAKTGTPEVPLLAVVKDQLWYRWLHGSTEKDLARAFGLTRETVERVLREQARERRPPAAVAWAERRAA